MWPNGAHAQASVKVARVAFLGLAPASAWLRSTRFFTIMWWAVRLSRLRPEVPEATKEFVHGYDVLRGLECWR
jgi:hypothetical protein